VVDRPRSTTAAWYRDLVVVAEGESAASTPTGRELREDAATGAGSGAETAAEVVRQAWREAEEFNLNPALFLEALFVGLRRVFSRAPSAAR
jgi:hypothetical protein